ncbi:hypothetical protein [Vulcanococcus sp.]|uniref:hypothetical protein n=1 Tax=Vulcanococcus sp. TaxID=2856995 RepID=UPI003F6A37E9
MPSQRPIPSSSRTGGARYRSLTDRHPTAREPLSTANTRWRRELDADLMAMGRVWQMIRFGAVRMLGEIGRQH